MIPSRMNSYLRERLPESAWDKRLKREGDLCFIEFDSTDVDQLARLGIEVDALGPHRVVCMWDSASPLEIGGYLVVDNLAMGKPSMGGIRMLPEVTPAAIHNLARGMTLKNAAAHLPYGGGKSGIVTEHGLSPEQHCEVIRGWAHLLYRYRDIYLPGPDVGTNDADMKTIAIENGIDHGLSKPADMGGNRIDQLGAAAGGTVICLQALLEEMHRLRVLPQFDSLVIPGDVTVLIQGFGAVGAHAARILRDRLPEAKVIGVSDAEGYLYDPEGLPLDELFQRWQKDGVVTRRFFLDQMSAGKVGTLKYSTEPNDLLRESAFCLIPAAPIANYLDIDAASKPAMTVDRMGKWNLIVEGANTYSPDPARKAARARMEQVVFRQRGTLIATDYLVNSGGVIFAAQEKLIKTPDELRIPQEILGNRGAVDGWLKSHAAEFAALAEKRRLAGDKHREDALRRNMRELVDVLLADTDSLPCQAAERISVRRIASKESGRTAADLMESLPTIEAACSLQKAAAKLVEAGSPMVAVVTAQAGITGVLTEWDITRATAQGVPDSTPSAEVMTRDVITCSPEAGILEMVHLLELHKISAMPVVENGAVLGMVSADLLARKSLAKLLQGQME
jgi:glutamate dehydrogenase/leucine dehydrogenase/CBS domain-containing protein